MNHPWSRETIPVGPLLVNSYLLSCPATGEAILVDPGEEPGRLLAEIRNSGCRLTRLLCTHGHFDHIAAAAAIQAEWDLPLECHPEETPLVSNMQAAQASYGFPPTPVPRHEAGLRDGMRLPFAGRELTVMHAPGHSPGHVVFVLEGDAFVGDVIFAGSIGRTDLPGGSLAVLERSIRTRIYTLPPETRLHPGHGPPTDVAREMATNPFVTP